VQAATQTRTLVGTGPRGARDATPPAPPTARRPAADHQQIAGATRRFVGVGWGGRARQIGCAPGGEASVRTRPPTAGHRTSCSRAGRPARPETGARALSRAPVRRAVHAARNQTTATSRSRGRAFRQTDRASESSAPARWVLDTGGHDCRRAGVLPDAAPGDAAGRRAGPGVPRTPCSARP